LTLFGSTPLHRPGNDSTCDSDRAQHVIVCWRVTSAFLQDDAMNARMNSSQKTA